MLAPYLAAPVLAWFMSQALKYYLLRKTGLAPKGFRVLAGSGNMPSVHTSVVVALTVVVGALEGLTSAIFALTLIFTIVVMYDAMQVRRATGELGTALAEMVTLTKLKLTRNPYQALGHHPLEVAAGIIIGILSAGIVLLF